MVRTNRCAVHRYRYRYRCRYRYRDRHLHRERDVDTSVDTDIDVGIGIDLGYRYASYIILKSCSQHSQHLTRIDQTVNTPMESGPMLRYHAGRYTLIALCSWSAQLEPFASIMPGCSKPLQITACRCCKGSNLHWLRSMRKSGTCCRLQHLYATARLDRDLLNSKPQSCNPSDEPTYP